MNQGFRPERRRLTEPGPAVFENGALLFFADSGRGTLHVNGVDMEIGKGSFGWLHSYHIYRFEPEWGDELELLCCPFDYASVSSVTYRDSLKITRTVMTEYSPVVRLEGAEAAYVKELLEEFICEGAGEYPADIVEGYSLFLEISTLFLRYSARDGKKQAGFERSLAWKLLQHIFTYSNENLTREKLASLYGVTEREVSCQLNLTAGESFARLLNRARVDRACDMLHYRGLTMQYIAHYVGFHSEVSFYRTFKRMVGQTPQEYQNAILPDSRQDPAPIDARALQILNYLFSQYREPLTVQDTAREVFIEKNDVNPLLKENFGMDHNEILTELRMTYSEFLLEHSSMPVADIAYAGGYRSVHTLIRVFSKRHGMTPGEYRRFCTHGEGKWREGDRR